MNAVLSQNEDIVMVDLEQQFWPYFFPKGWGPLALWVHVILTLEDSKTSKKGMLAVCRIASCSFVAWHSTPEPP